MENNNNNNKEVPNSFLADRLAGKVDERGNSIVPEDEQLGQTNEVPTHLGGIKLESEQEVENSPEESNEEKQEAE